MKNGNNLKDGYWYELKEIKSYKAHGLVYGQSWGGGNVAYPAEELISDTKEDLIAQIEAGIKDGSLDSGMGFVILIGALMIIETERKIIIENVAYRNTTTKRYYSKGLNPKEKWFLGHNLY